MCFAAGVIQRAGVPESPLLIHAIIIDLVNDYVNYISKTKGAGVLTPAP